jgi:predicted metal-dependent hydrolase
MGIVNHPTLGKIECVRSVRARSIRLVVRRDGSLRLSYPLFASQRKAIAFAETKQAWIEAVRSRFMERVKAYPTISRRDVSELRNKARGYVPETIARLAKEHGFGYTSLRISSAHTRWGSCSGKNGISISLFIMLLPEHLREFIILHELCHTRHHNHSAAFHALLDSCVGGKEKLFNKELKSYHIPRIVED